MPATITYRRSVLESRAQCRPTRSFGRRQTRIEREFDPEAVRQMKAASGIRYQCGRSRACRPGDQGRIVRRDSSALAAPAWKGRRDSPGRLAFLPDVGNAQRGGSDEPTPTQAG